MIDKDNILISLAKQYTTNKDVDVTLLSTFKHDLMFDSLSLTEFIIACEDEFGIEIDLDDPKAYNIKNLNDLLKLIEID